MPLSPSLSPSLKADAYENGVAKTPLKAPAGANYSGAVKVSPTWSNYSEGDPVLVRPIETGHEGEISSVSFSPDGTTLATGSSDKTVKLLDVGSASVTKTIETGHEDYIRSVSFSPDGTTLATGSGDKTVKLLEPARYGYGPDGLLLAHPTFDLWSYGVVLYYAIAHKPLIDTTGADQLRGKPERMKLANWTDQHLTQAINDLDHGMTATRSTRWTAAASSSPPSRPTRTSTPRCSR